VVLVPSPLLPMAPALVASDPFVRLVAAIAPRQR
jgi:hypothetical protein